MISFILLVQQRYILVFISPVSLQITTDTWSKLVLDITQESINKWFYNNET